MADGDVFGKVVFTCDDAHLITGAGSGIGAALARVLHERGDDLLLVARSDERAAELREEFAGAETVVADLEDSAAWNARWRPTRCRRGSTRSCTRPGTSTCSRSPTSTSAPGSVSSRSTSRRRRCWPGPPCRHCASRRRDGRAGQLRRRTDRAPGVVGVRRLQVRPACPRRLPARRGGRQRRPRHLGLPRPHRHPDAGEGARAGGQGVRRRRLEHARDRRRVDPARARPAGRLGRTGAGRPPRARARAEDSRMHPSADQRRSGARSASSGRRSGPSGAGCGRGRRSGPRPRGGTRGSVRRSRPPG